MTKNLKEFGPNLSREEGPRPSRESLDKIKKYSDENIQIINSKIHLCEETKRDIIVNLISALDYYIHDIIIWGIIEITENGFPEGINYRNFKISIEHVKNALSSSHELDKSLVKQEIIKILSYETYQKWINIRNGLKFILPDEINKKIGLLTKNNKDLNFSFETTPLETLNKVRNSIVHTFDRNLHDESSRNKITIDINEALNYVSLVIDSIHSILIEYDSTEPENS